MAAADTMTAILEVAPAIEDPDFEVKQISLALEHSLQGLPHHVGLIRALIGPSFLFDQTHMIAPSFLFAVASSLAAWLC